MLSIVHELQVPFIAMHMRGDPQTMTSPLHSTYVNATEEIGSELASRLTLISQHIPRWLQIVDPGIGFAKGAMVNQEILKPANLSALKRRWGERPMVVGLSRKRFLSALAEPCSDNVTYDGKRSQRSSPAMPSISLDDRDCLTAGANMVALLGGADILRVHNVRQTRLTERAFERMYYDH